MKHVLILSLLLTSFGSCKDKNVQDGCAGPDRIVFKNVKAAFLESGFIVLESEQDSAYMQAKVPYIYCQPCSTVKLATLKVQKDKGPITLNYEMTCGMKYDDSRVNYTNMPTPKIIIYSVRPL